MVAQDLSELAPRRVCSLNAEQETISVNRFAIFSSSLPRQEIS